MTTPSKSDRDAAEEYASGVNGGEYSDDYGVRLYSFMSGIQHGREEERQRAKVLLDALFEIENMTILWLKDIETMTSKLRMIHKVTHEAKQAYQSQTDG